MKTKSMLTAIGVIILGLGVGAAFSYYSIPKKISSNNYLSKSSIQRSESSAKNKSTDKNTDITAEESSGQLLRANSTTIQSAGTRNDYDKIEKTILSVNYKNNTKSDLSSVQVWLEIRGINKYELAPFPTVKYDVKASKEHPGYKIFTVPGVKAGATASMSTYLISRDAGKIRITAQIHAGKEVIKTNTIILTAN